ncbi:MAG: FtsX-like permease family protein [Oscillospiraceae bacterium]|nr:FtsX-like permease family protein [Oscillospiraceae bacterium]
MKTSDMIIMCLNNLRRRPMRTFLTTLGVIIGTCAIVVMISFGVAMSKSQEEMLAQMGDLTMITINNWSGGDPDIPTLDDKMVAEIGAYDGVEAISPIVRADWGKIVIDSGKYKYEDSIYGANLDALEKLGYTLAEGSYPQGNEKEIAVLFGSQAAYSFRDTKKSRNNYVYPWDQTGSGEIPDPYVDVLKDDMTISITVTDEDDKPKIKAHKIKCTGKFAEDYNKYETVYGVFMSIEDLNRLNEEYNKVNGTSGTSSGGNKKSYETVYVKVNDINSVEAVEEKIQALGYNTYSMESIRKPMQEEALRTQLFLGGIGLVAMLVAALCIANTMYMSIYERTREIGIMKVIGCVVGNIRTTFLMEAGFIGFFGGVIGVVLSYLISFLFNVFGGGTSFLGGGMMWYGGGGGSSMSVIPLWLVVLALGFATLVGLVSGYFPSNRAVKISALEAIKHDG